MVPANVPPAIVAARATGTSRPNSARPTQPLRTTHRAITKAPAANKGHHQHPQRDQQRRRTRSRAVDDWPETYPGYDDAAPAPEAPPPPPPRPESVSSLFVHYYRHDGFAHQFGMHVWDDVYDPTPWDAPLAPGVAGAFCDATDRVHTEGWVTYEVKLPPEGAKTVSFVIHRGEEQCVRIEGLDVEAMATRPSSSIFVVSGQAQARSISHWSPYDRVRVVNADP
jgi:hypothetical protein